MESAQTTTPKPTTLPEIENHETTSTSKPRFHLKSKQIITLSVIGALILMIPLFIFAAMSRRNYDTRSRAASGETTPTPLAVSPTPTPTNGPKCAVTSCASGFQKVCTGKLANGCENCSCKAVSTPRPVQTPFPTKKPIATPTVKPSATPKPTVPPILCQYIPTLCRYPR